MKILVIEDNPELAQNMTEYLQREGYVCELADNHPGRWTNWEPLPTVGLYWVSWYRAEAARTSSRLPKEKKSTVSSLSYPLKIHWTIKSAGWSLERMIT